MKDLQENYFKLMAAIAIPDYELGNYL